MMLAPGQSCPLLASPGLCRYPMPSPMLGNTIHPYKALSHG